MKCPKCKQEFHDESLFCPDCGLALTEEEPAEGEETPAAGVSQETRVFEPVEEREKAGEKKPFEPLNVVGRFRDRQGSLWSGMTQFSRGWFSVLALAVMMLAIAAFSGRKVPLAVSLVQLALLAVAMLAHKQVIPALPDWVKVVIVVLAVALTGLNAYSYSFGTKAPAAPEPAPTEQVQTALPEEPEQAVEEAAPPAQAETKPEPAPETKIDPADYASAPFGAADCAWKDSRGIRESLEKAGFTTITVEELEDLDYDMRDQAGKLEMVSIGGRTNYAAGEMLLKTDPVIIRVHTLMQVKAPFSGIQAVAMDPEMLRKQLMDAGFGNIESSKLFDLDPDESQWEYTNLVTIEGSEDFLLGQSYPADARVEIVTHLPFEKYTLNLKVNCSRNLIFSTYDVEVSLDGESLGTLTHGTSGEFTARLRPGTYTLTFSKVGNSSIGGSMELEILNDYSATVSISCRNDGISVN